MKNPQMGGSKGLTPLKKVKKKAIRNENVNRGYRLKYLIYSLNATNNK